MRLLLVIALAASLGCSDSTTPAETFKAAYSLSLVDDQALPAIIELVGITATEHRVASGDLTFAGGRATQRIYYDSRPRNAEPTPTYEDSTSSTFTVNGAMVLISREGRDEATTDTGFIQGDLLILNTALRTSLNLPTPARHTLKFVKVATQ